MLVPVTCSGAKHRGWYAFVTLRSVDEKSSFPFVAILCWTPSKQKVRKYVDLTCNFSVYYNAVSYRFYLFISVVGTTMENDNGVLVDLYIPRKW